MSAPSSATGGGAMNLSSFHPFILCGNVRLHHRHGSGAGALERWIRGCVVQVRSSGGVAIGREGDLVLGELHPPPAGGQDIRVRDHLGDVHLLQPRDATDPASLQRPLRVLAVLGNRESSTHVCGGVFDPSFATSVSKSGVGAGGMPLVPGTSLAWLGEEGGLVGHLVSDSPGDVVLGTRDESEGGGVGSGGLEHVPRAGAFNLLGPLLDANTGRAVNISSLCPTIPPSITSSTSAAQLPRLLLVGGTSSSCGKTSLACSMILALHSLAFESGREAPRVAYLKLTGSGGSRDLARVRTLKNPRGQPAVCLAFDHVDVGFATTYGPPVVTATPAEEETAATAAAAAAASALNERFKQAVTDLLALASQPCAVPSVVAALPSSRRHAAAASASSAAPPQTPSSQQPVSPALLPPDFIVGELGSDLIWSSNPLLLSLGSIHVGLLGLMVVTSDALSLLGACGYLNGTLGFPQHLLHLVCGHTKNFEGMYARIRGSAVQLHRNDYEHTKALIKAILESQPQQPHSRPQPLTPTAAAATAASSSSAAAPAAPLTPLQHTTALPTRSANSSPRAGNGNGVNSQTTNTHATNGNHVAVPSSSSSSSTTVVAAASATTNWPASATAPSFTARGGGGGVSAEDSLAWFERTYVPWVSTGPLEHSTAPTPYSPQLSALWISLIEWVMSCSTPPPPLGGEVTAPAKFSWDESDLCLMLRRLSRSDRLGRTLGYMSALRRRDKLRARIAKDAEEAQRTAMGDLLGKLANAKSGHTPSSSPSTSIATPSATSATPGSGGGESAASTQALLLALPDLCFSPYALPVPVPAVGPPASAAGLLLDFDPPLAALRLAAVPSRVNEDTFWNTYFQQVFHECRAYIALKQREHAAAAARKQRG